ncbi:hypothetical protein G7054_g3723 [Neopestalotiopsis clavispora]|nr:hypothetical protein G7054_g3723 [Neopestalotiopsis clavispora]
MASKHHESVARRPEMSKNKDPNPIEYENTIYQKGLRYERPPFTFKPLDWERLAEERMSAESKGYVVGSAGTGETARKNREAFGRWSIVPRRLVKTAGFPDLSVEVLGKRQPFPIACAPVGVQRIFNPDGEVAAATGRTMVVVAHRLATVQNADVIFVLGEGRVLEKGNHQELLRKKGVYWNMCQSQALDR